MEFSFFSYLALIYEIIFLFIFIIVLLDSLDTNGCPITTAVKKNSLEIVKFLVEHGANVNAKIILFHAIFIIILM